MNRHDWIEKNGSPTSENWHDFYLCQVEDVVENGLPGVYVGVDEWLADLNIGDVPWSEKRFSEFSRNVEQDSRFENLVVRFEEKFGQTFWEVE